MTEGRLRQVKSSSGAGLAAGFGNGGDEPEVAKIELERAEASVLIHELSSLSV